MPDSPDDAATYRGQKDALFRLATTASIPSIIRMGSKFIQNKTLVDDQIDFFKRKSPTLPPRVHKLYGYYKAIVHEVLLNIEVRTKIFSKHARHLTVMLASSCMI